MEQEIVLKRVDEFFVKVSKDDIETVRNWLLQEKAKDRKSSRKVRRFLNRVEKALETVDYDYWIPTLEPSVENGKICYGLGKHAGVGYSCLKWNKMALEYAPERGSRQGTFHELDIWYALRIANGLWTLKYVAEDSSSAGNYWDSPETSFMQEKTGAREVGGFRDGTGNTCKVVTTEKGYVYVGGNHYEEGAVAPVADETYPLTQWSIHHNAVGIVVLTK